MVEVRLINITKKYADVKAVDNLSLSIKGGEFVVLVGPSGCGKTTTLRMIAGLEDVTEGTIYIGKTLVNNIPPKDRDIAMVFQNYALYPHMNVFENMAFGLKLRKYREDEIKIRVHNAAKLLGIEDLLQRKPKALSGGQRQRVAMGRAIVRNPAVFLFDEPLSNLDAKLRVQMRVELRMLQKRLGTTTIYVTHDQVEAMTLADRIAIMNKGILMQVGTPKEVYDTPKNTFVGSFIGSPSMNFINGKIEKDRDNYIIKTEIFMMSFEKEFLQKHIIKEDDFTITFEKNILQKFESLISNSVTLGIRPNHILHILGKNRIEKNAFIGKVNVIEHMGSEKYGHISTGKEMITVQLQVEDPLREGDEGCFFIDSKKIHIFDESGNNILFG